MLVINSYIITCFSCKCKYEQIVYTGDCLVFLFNTIYCLVYQYCALYYIIIHELVYHYYITSCSVFALDHESSTKAEREKNRTLRQNRREAIRAKQMAELLEKVGNHKTIFLIREPIIIINDRNKCCLLFQRQSQSTTGTTEGTSTKSKKMLKGVTSKTCTGPGCDKLAISPSLYCSEDCIKK